MTNAGSHAAEATGEREYCRFGKRNLDGMSWLAPLVNNRLGDRLNLELRHEQLFFIKGNQVLEDVGYSEKGQRFTETQFGKPIHSLEDLKRNGYWLVGPEYDPAVMREALAEQKDGYYYSLFANQCQDWADRLRRSAERLETQRGVQPGHIARSAAPHYSKPVSPTEPASIWMGLLAILLGGASIVGPIVAGRSIHGPGWNRVPSVRCVAHCLRAACEGLAEFSSLLASCLGSVCWGHFDSHESSLCRGGERDVAGDSHHNSRHTLDLRGRGKSTAHPRSWTSRRRARNASLCRADCRALAEEQ